MATKKVVKKEVKNVAPKKVASKRRVPLTASVPDSPAVRGSLGNKRSEYFGNKNSKWFGNPAK